MERLKLLLGTLIIISIFSFISTTHAQTNLERSVVATGGGLAENSSFLLNSTVGQKIIGSTVNSSTQLWLGFWNVNHKLVDANEDDLLIPEKFELFQNFPNPFNPSTKIKYAIPEASTVIMEVFNILGERIVQLINTEKNPGFYTIDFNASNLSSGFYFYRIQANKFTDVKKMILIK